MGSLLRKLYDPASDQFHHFLTPDGFNERFSPTPGDYEAVQTFFRSHGLSVTRTVRSRTILGVRGSVADIENVFHVAMRLYQHPTESRAFYAPDNDLSLDLPVPVLSVAGLNNYIVPRPMSLQRSEAAGQQRPTPASGSGPSGNYIGNDFRAAYVPGVTLTGAGQSVALVEFDSGFYQSDITAYESLASLPNTPVQAVLLDGYDGSAGSGNDEVSLDIEMVMSMAPGISSISVVEGSSPDDVLMEMADPSQGEALAYQLSASWTYSVDTTSEQLFQRFASQGQSFFNASGDSDAYCSGNPVQPPTADTNITSVGGTTLNTTGPGGAYVSETVWNWGLDGSSYVGGSGGIGSDPIPPWQQGISMTTNLGSTTLRNIPDVALTANEIWVLFGDGSSGSFGGTSCATPLWAAFAALVNEQAVSLGKPTAGFLNPALYACGKSANYATLFNDVVSGNNNNNLCGSLFEACPGYDLCTGWGTPTPALLSTLSAGPDALQIEPTIGFSSSGGVGGPFTLTSASFVLTNAGTNALNWSLSNTSAWLNASPTGGTLTSGGAATSVKVSLNAAANNLTAGAYIATLAFTNLSDTNVQLRQFQLAVISPPVVTNQPATQTVPDGTTAMFGVGVSGGTPLSYQWQFNSNNLADGNSISGSTTATLTIGSVAPADAGYYRVIVTNAAGMTVSSNALLTPVAGSVNHFTWSAIASPQTYNQPINATITALDVDNVVATGYAGSVALSGSATTGALALSPANSGPFSAGVWNGTIAVLQPATNAVLLANDGAGHTGSSSAFNVVLPPDQPPAINIQPTNVTALLGGSATFAVGAFGTAPLSYSWLDGGTAIIGATNSSFTTNSLPLSASGSQFTCIVTNLYGSATSHVATLTVVSNVVKQALVLYDYTGTTPFATALTNLGIPCQIYTNSNFFNAVTNANPSTTLVIVDAVFNQYASSFPKLQSFIGAGGRVIFYYWNLSSVPAMASALDASDYEAFDNPMPVYNWGNTTLFTNVSTPLSFQAFNLNINGELLQPAGGGTAAAGFTSSPTADEAGMIIGNGGQTIINGFTMDEITPTANGLQLAMNEIQFVSGATGGSGPPSIASQPANVVVPSGTSATFAVSAFGSPPLSYSWLDDGTAIAGATNSSFTTNNVPLTANGSQFSCIVSNTYGAVTSHVATLTVSATLVLNGGFELGSFADWTEGGNFQDCSVTTSSSYVHSGSHGAELGPLGSLGYISQTLATTAGQSYLISCWVISDGGTPNEFSVSWNGSTRFDETDLPFNGWTNVQFIAPATTSSTVLAIGFRDDPGFLGLDDISVVPVPVVTISGIQLSGANLVINGLNGLSGETEHVLTSTNLALPLNQWTPISTNVLNANGDFTITVPNAVFPGAAQQFYILQSQ